MKTITETKPETYVSAVRKLAAKHGKITPELVLSAAKRKSSPLHTYFVWDDTTAAKRYRELQAQHLIRSIKVTYEPTENVHVRVREFVCVTPEAEAGHDAAGNIYVPYSEAIRVESYRDQVMHNCKRDAESFRQKYRSLQEAAAIIEAMEPLFNS